MSKQDNKIRKNRSIFRRILNIERVIFNNNIESDDKKNKIREQLTSKDRKNNQTVRTSKSSELINRAIKGEYIYGIIGQILGFISILGGIILCVNSVTGSTSWTAKLFALESNITDAAPGVVLFIVGIFIVWATRPKVNMKDFKG